MPGKKALFPRCGQLFPSPKLLTFFAERPLKAYQRACWMNLITAAILINIVTPSSQKLKRCLLSLQFPFRHAYPFPHAQVGQKNVIQLSGYAPSGWVAITQKNPSEIIAQLTAASTRIGCRTSALGCFFGVMLPLNVYAVSVSPPPPIFWMDCTKNESENVGK